MFRPFPPVGSITKHGGYLQSKSELITCNNLNEATEKEERMLYAELNNLYPYTVLVLIVALMCGRVVRFLFTGHSEGGFAPNQFMVNGYSLYVCAST